MGGRLGTCGCGCGWACWRSQGWTELRRLPRPDPVPAAAALPRATPRKKEHTQHLQQEIAALTAQNSALEGLLQEIRTAGARRPRPPALPRAQPCAAPPAPSRQALPADLAAPVAARCAGVCLLLEASDAGIDAWLAAPRPA